MWTNAIFGTPGRLNEWSPRSRWVVTAQILYGFVNGLSESDREDLLKIVASAIATLGTAEQADSACGAHR
ncbi:MULTISPECIES: hypothetical protein [unclassified Nonomuraea]|uniref:hypothetical protein n=1 Tax=unclassified Nonomuraea TaxID=2593643 RepID=UPI0033F2BA9D